MSTCCCSSCGETTALVCPACGAPGRSVSLETVKSLTKETGHKIKGDFCVCLTPDCDIVYFSHDTVFSQNEISVPVAWKDGAEPKYVCYCNRVTEGDIIRAVTENGAKTLSDIVRLTGAMKNGQCVANNPQGVCCHADIEQLLQRAVKKQ